MDDAVILTIDTPEPGILVFTLTDPAGAVRDREECRYEGPVDNLVLTIVDKLLKRSNLDRFALKAVETGQRIDKSSSLYRIVQSVAAAVAAVR